MPTFSGPLKVKSKNGYATDRDVGDVVLSKEVAWTFEDTALTIQIPEGSNILDIIVDVEVAVVVADPGTALMDVGVTGTAELYMANVNLETLGRTRASATAAKLVNLGTVTDGTILLALGGTDYEDATAGSGRVIVQYTTQG